MPTLKVRYAASGLDAVAALRELANLAGLPLEFEYFLTVVECRLSDTLSACRDDCLAPTQLRTPDATFR